MAVSEKMAYLRGLVSGLDLDLTSSKEGKVLGAILELLDDMTEDVVRLDDVTDELMDACAPLLEDDGEDAYFETTCPNCDFTFSVDDFELENGEIKCPYCGEVLLFDYTDLLDVNKDEDDDEIE